LEEPREISLAEWTEKLVGVAIELLSLEKPMDPQPRVLHPYPDTPFDATHPTLAGYHYFAFAWFMLANLAHLLSQSS
jgi:hypothetical protein